jgi:methionyl-tRNA formyltransferase
MRIVFLGTPDFAVESLKAIINSGYNVVAVVTAPDKPAGRGLQLKASPVKQCAESLGIPVLQPNKLKDPAFLEALRAYRADVQVVVAFRMLPEKVWNMPPLGTWNLHASLLPAYRGAAPINHALINGEKITGLTTFKLVHAIDEGAIGLQLPIIIDPDETAGELHDKMAIQGGTLISATLKALENKNLNLLEQCEVEHQMLPHAPKLNPAFCKINWNQNANALHNHIRGLSPYPGAFSTLHNGDETLNVKIFKGVVSEQNDTHSATGAIKINEARLFVAASDAWYEVLEIQPAGKKRMPVRDFLLGFRVKSTLYFD